MKIWERAWLAGRREERKWESHADLRGEAVRMVSCEKRDSEEDGGMAQFIKLLPTIPVGVQA